MRKQSCITAKISPHLPRERGAKGKSKYSLHHKPDPLPGERGLKVKADICYTTSQSPLPLGEG